MTSAQVVATSVNNSSFQNYPHPDDHTIRTTDTPGFKPFTMLCSLGRQSELENLVNLKKTSAQVVETSVTNNSSFENYAYPDDHTVHTN